MFLDFDFSILGLITHAVTGAIEAFLTALGDFLTGQLTGLLGSE